MLKEVKRLARDAGFELLGVSNTAIVNATQPKRVSY